MKRLIAFCAGALLSSAAAAQNPTAGAAVSFTPQSANTIMAGPATGSAAVPTFRALTSADIPASALPSVSASTILANPTSGTQAAAAYSPLYVTNMQSAPSLAQVYVMLGTGAGQTPAYGSGQSIDGVTLQPGMEVFVGSALNGQTCGANTTINGTGGAIQTTGYCLGKWTVVANGPWTRPVDFPDRYTFAANCNYAIQILQGALYQDSVWRLISSASQQIDFAALSFVSGSLPLASPTTSAATPGLVAQTTKAQSSDEVVPVMFTLGIHPYDCIGDDGGGLGALSDSGNVAGTQGSCVTSDANGHPILNGTGTGPTVTSISGGTCTKDAAAQDNSGAVTVSAAAVCKVAFASTGFTNKPFCVVSGSATTTLPIISTQATSGSGGFFQFTAAAAGIVTYVCL